MQVRDVAGTRTPLAKDGVERGVEMSAGKSLSKEGFNSHFYSHFPLFLGEAGENESNWTLVEAAVCMCSTCVDLQITVCLLLCHLEVTVGIWEKKILMPVDMSHMGFVHPEKTPFSQHYKWSLKNMRPFYLKLNLRKSYENSILVMLSSVKMQ